MEAKYFHSLSKARVMGQRYPRIKCGCGRFIWSGSTASPRWTFSERAWNSCWRDSDTPTPAIQTRYYYSRHSFHLKCIIMTHPTIFQMASSLLFPRPPCCKSTASRKHLCYYASTVQSQSLALVSFSKLHTALVLHHGSIFLYRHVMNIVNGHSRVKVIYYMVWYHLISSWQTYFNVPIIWVTWSKGEKWRQWR